MSDRFTENSFLSSVMLTQTKGLSIRSIWLTDQVSPSGTIHDISHPGQKSPPELGKAIEDCRSTIIVLSKRSVESGW
jgi:hypothetical protein